MIEKIEDREITAIPIREKDLFRRILTEALAARGRIPLIGLVGVEAKTKDRGLTDETSYKLKYSFLKADTSSLFFIQKISMLLEIF